MQEFISFLINRLFKWKKNSQRIWFFRDCDSENPTRVLLLSSRLIFKYLHPSFFIEYVLARTKNRFVKNIMQIYMSLFLYIRIIYIGISKQSDQYFISIRCSESHKIKNNLYYFELICFYSFHKKIKLTHLIICSTSNKRH